MNLHHLAHPNFHQRITALVWSQVVLRWLGLPLLGLMAASGSMGWVWLLPGAGLCWMFWAALRAWELSLRRQFVRDAEFPGFLTAKIIAAHPALQQRDAELVLRGLRQFFMAYLRSGRQFVGMPSKVVDTAWHEYILHTRGYQLWCQRAFGRMLHHTPAEVMRKATGVQARQHNDGLRRTWYWACKEESINPRQPSRLPLLFALDAKYGIAGGFHYVPDCKAIGQQSDSGAYCGGDFASSDSGESGSGDFGGSDSSSSSASSSASDGGSDGGSCGGGCGGGD
jgi:hypothetical protein